ncbi:autotransporter assembly complex protein TamA [Beggiatoa leptomitoformis]|uniref:Translocation and assembly module subunit TamA n=1 Tax=Beggiatoa leptomitoformis TaxID=288004 RepID=A0A2N9YF25_9GAMM|nr:BamA/TamA family outer membrane protein [Beggiatoa leptomitoformis]ALG68636.1 BamA/TamA family outer membrane protein [Beggiatoa leptomitoformis]AUI69015.1 BamA/TamA family outer membrane protein [Beggiatoa leptomitoformis]
MTSSFFSYRVWLFFLLFIGCCLSPISHAETESPPPPPPSHKVIVTITGISDILLNNVKAYLSIEQQKEHPNLNPNRIRRLHKLAPEEIQKSLQPFGYYRVVVDATLTEPAQGETVWQVTYAITLGAPLLIDKVDIKVTGDGENDDAFQDILRKPPIVRNAILDHQLYEKLKKSLFSLTEERGYFDAQWQRTEIRVDEKAYTAEVYLWLETGTRYRFGNVVFKQDIFSDAFMQQFLTFQTGEYFTNAKLLEMSAKLAESDYFASVRVDALRNQRDAKQGVPIDVGLEMNSRNRLRSRLGYGTDTGIRLSEEWERRYVNQRGHRLLMDGIYIQERNKYIGDIGYVIPFSQVQKKDLTFNFRYEGEDIDANNLALGLGFGDSVNANAKGSTRREMFSLSVNKQESRDWFLPVEEVIGLTYFTEKYNLLSLLTTPEDYYLIDYLIATGDIGADELEVLDANFKVLMPSVHWTYTEADNRRYTTRGQQVGLNLAGAIDGLGSNLSFAQAHLHGMFIRPLFNKGRVLLRGDIAYTQAKTVKLLDTDITGSVLPKSLQFLTGGDRTVRGYAYESILQENSAIAGKHLLIASAEYEYKFLQDWSVAVFYDMGNAFNTYNELKLRQGAGAGIRWYSPVGLVRLDVATPIAQEDSSIKVHLVIGPDF